MNIPGFRVCQVPEYASLAQGSGYALMWMNSILWHCSKYAWSTIQRVLYKPKYARAQIMVRF